MAGNRWQKGRSPVRNRRDDRLARLHPAAFEARVAEHYRRQGYDVERVGHGGAHFDGGIDLKLRRGDEYIVVQCKRESAYQVTHNVGHELIGVMCTQAATGAIVVNSGEFTDAARSSAQREPRLTLVDGDEVRRWFPELACEVAEQTWEPVGHGLDLPARRRRGRQRNGESGAKAVVAMAFLVALMLWQCSRSDPRTNERRAPNPPAAEPSRSLPASQAAPPATLPKAHNMAEPSISMEEWERRNRESMEILRETTPEIDLAP
ncbi:restriction endonuclease [uncultured Luteimonas sp.]|uniref:restriction endonuclease n=1 Tax=uncultured Luteimonas sp. TaxID=453144 RepID=UPI002625EB1F|nr:restriction endonuclease [uncultured Luteimonas sp.]